MGTGMILLGWGVFALGVFVLIGGPAMLTDWRRHRQAAAIGRQIALTDALDGRLGPIVSPVVTRPLWGPWQVQIAVPFTRPGLVGTILQVVEETLAPSPDAPGDRYRIVLTPQPDANRAAGAARPNQSAAPWLADPRLAA